jgi:hypothetical protein
LQKTAAKSELKRKKFFLADSSGLFDGRIYLFWVFMQFCMLNGRQVERKEGKSFNGRAYEKVNYAKEAKSN